MNTTPARLLTTIRTATVCIALGLLALTGTARASGGKIYVADYPASTDTNELQLRSIYTIWVPDNVAKLRGVIVHQHGAGIPASQEGLAAAYDLHWQALAKKWDCALLSPSYCVSNSNTGDIPGGSQLWFDPRRGSDKTFLRSLNDFATQSGHSELNSAPWVLWGHSGGGIWSDVMSSLHPDRIIAMWLRSGSSAMWRGKAHFQLYDDPEGVYGIPIVVNSGLEETNNVTWNGPLTTVREHRAHNGPIAFAPDPLTGHWCGNSRYLAIPYLDAVMALRLPDIGSTNQTLKPIDMNSGWLAPIFGSKAVPAAGYRGPLTNANWLPNETIAKDWAEYVTTGDVSDTTPPPAPYNVTVVDNGERGSVITWDADADFESGIHHFIIMRDGYELGNWPSVNQVRFHERATFQTGSSNTYWMNTFGDAPGYPPRPMRFEDPNPKDSRPVTYEVIEVNTVGLKSAPAPASTIINRAPRRGGSQGGRGRQGGAQTNQPPRGASGGAGGT